MKNGDDVTVLYQSSNPDNIAEGNITGNAVIMIVAGAAFVVIGLAMGIKAVIRPLSLFKKA